LKCIKNETLYCNNDYYNETKYNDFNNKVINKQNAVSHNFLEKNFKNNISNFNNCNSDNKNDNKILNGTTSNKFFLFEVKENKFSENTASAFFDFIKTLNINKCCFDKMTDNQTNIENINNVFLVFKNESEFKKFFMEFIKENSDFSKYIFNNYLENSHNAIDNYNSSTIKTNDQKDTLNIDFLKVIINLKKFNFSSLKFYGII
jgi:hypothetical protein